MSGDLGRQIRAAREQLATLARTLIVLTESAGISGFDAVVDDLADAQRGLDAAADGIESALEDLG